MRTRPDPAFVSQFQWEVDRWVFRYRQKGAPVEVTKAEAEVLIRQHARRQAICVRAFFLALLVTGVFCAGHGRLAVMLPIIWLGMIVTGVPFYRQWAYKDVTRHLEERTPIGLPLDRTGQFARMVRGLSWRQLVLFFLAFAIFGGPTLARAGTRLSDLPMVVLDMAILTLLLVIVVIKWGQHEQGRAHERNLEEMRRTREWR